MTTPAVSVIIPAYNYGRFLAQALDSALGQTLDDLEVIIVDDGSTDDTGEVVARYLRCPRLRYWRTPHVGQSKTKNVALRLARAPLIAFLDADDVWLPTKLEKQVALFESKPDVDVVYTRRTLIDPEGRGLQYCQPKCLPRGHVLEALVRDNFICFSSAVVRRRVFAAVGDFDESLPLAIDYDLWLRAGLRFAFDFVDEPLVRYRTGHVSLSKRIEERLGVVDRILRRFLDERGGRAVLPAAVVREALATTCYHRALYGRSRSRLAALPWYIRCLAFDPGYALAWQGLATLALPEAVRRRMRTALGRPADWSVRATDSVTEV